MDTRLLHTSVGELPAAMLAFASAARVLEDAAAKISEEILIMQRRTARAVSGTRDASEAIAGPSSLL
jgi:hypothetical protein